MTGAPRSAAAAVGVEQDHAVVLDPSGLPDDLSQLPDGSHDPDAPLDVALLRWPEDAALRHRLAVARRPRLLLVAADHMPPVAADEIEDWIRFPIDPDDLEARTTTLLVRASRVIPRPFSVTLDSDDVAHADGRWAALAPLEARALARLLARPGETVARRVLVEACWPEQQPEDLRALDSVVRRLRRRVAPLGLRIHTVPRAGFILDHVPGVPGVPDVPALDLLPDRAGEPRGRPRGVEVGDQPPVS